jgi:hypothetical protein
VCAGSRHARWAGPVRTPIPDLDKSTSALADTVNGHPDGADLALVTCGGNFDRAAGASEDNEVLFASVV